MASKKLEAAVLAFLFFCFFFFFKQTSPLEEGLMRQPTSLNASSCLLLTTGELALMMSQEDGAS